MRRHVFLIGISLLCLVLFSGEASPADISPEIGKYAPAFELKDLEGREISLAELRGKVILLNFWSTTCIPCKTEMPSLNSLYAAFKDEGFLLLGISVDSSEKPVRAFAAEKKIQFPILIDRDRAVYFDQYAVFGLPTSFLIDSKGMIVEKFLGPREWDAPDVKSKITGLLPKK